MKLTRKELLLGGAAGAALGAAGIYELVDKLADSPPGALRRGPRARAAPARRHARREAAKASRSSCRCGITRSSRLASVAPQDQLLEARADARAGLAKLDADYPRTPDGLGVTVAWGLPYFRTHVPDAADVHLPFDLRASKPRAARRDPLPERPARDAARGERRRLPPPQRQRASTSGRRARRSPTASKGALARDEHPQGLRRRRIDGGQSLPKEMATAAGVPGADLIPDGVGALPRLHVDAAERARPAADRELRDARLRRPRAARVLPRRHAHAPLAHLRGPRGVVPQLRLPRSRDTRRSGRGCACGPGRRRWRSRRSDVASESEVRRDYDRFGIDRAQLVAPAGLAAAARRARARTGRSTAKGTAIPQRADFNTLDNPFFWSADPKRDRMGDGAGRGPPLRRLQPDERRLPPQPARDGRRHCPTATKLQFVPRAPRAGLQLDPEDDAPAELPRPAEAAPLVPARRALDKPERSEGAAHVPLT